MERDAIDLGTLKISTLFKKFFIPTLLGMLSISTVAAVDGIFVGHGIGSDGIAAVNICIPLLMVFTGIGLMIGSGCSVIASVHLSRGQLKAARINVTQALLFVTVVTVLISSLILMFPTRVALLLGSSENLLPMVIDYLVWSTPTFTFQIWTTIALFIIRLDGAPKLAMWCSVITAITNVFLDWLFIFPLGWGLMGAGLASSISAFVGGAVAISYLLFFARNLKTYPLKWSHKSLQLSLRNIGYQCRIGFSSFLGETTLAMLMFVGNQVFMHYLGDDGVSAFGIGCYYLPFVFMIGNAIAQSAQPIISYNFGINNRDRVALTGKTSIRTAIVCGMIVMSLFVFFPDVLVGLFLSSDNAAAHIAIEGFPYFACGFIFFITNLADIGCYQSLERVKPAIAFALLRGFIYLILSFVFMPKLFGHLGIWLAMPVSEILTTLTIICFYTFPKIYNE